MLTVIMGPTASGKTAVATHLAYLLDGVVISGDSRQVYKGMDIGTGKDLSEYVVHGKQIPYYLIDICEPGEEYNIYRYKQDFYRVYHSIPEDTPKILCGGSGLYIESVLNNYRLTTVPEDPKLRKKLGKLPMEKLVEMLKSYGPLHNTTDTTSKKRVIRALEIAYHSKEEAEVAHTKGEGVPLQYRVFAIDVSRELRRQRISDRLKARLEEGMIEEVQGLLKAGVSPQRLIQYGLEYRFITLYLMGELPLEEAVRKLEIAIHQFAKRQMTWLRGMPKRGIQVTWIEPLETPLATATYITQFI